MSGICLNEDNSHFFSSRDENELNNDGINKWVDQYGGTQVREIMLNVNGMRTSYESRVWDNIWDGYDTEGDEDQPIFKDLPKEERKGARNWVHTAWLASRNGMNIYSRWIERIRKHGISPWISVRMNDVHNVDNEKNFMHSELWRNHPELRRAEYRWCSGWVDKAFDYGQKEVRDHYFNLIKEIAEMYDIDGLELDWMRFGFHFRPGYEAEGAEILTGFMADVRKLLNDRQERRGHKISLGVRVPSRPQTSLGLGMDAVTWAGKGLIDMLVITPFWETVETDMPVEIWKQLLSGSQVILAAGLEILIRAYPDSNLFQTNSLETVRGAAISLLDRGADRIYLFNYMDRDTCMDDLHNYPILLCEAGYPETLSGKQRRHVLTYSDTWAPGEPKAFALPAECIPGRYSQFRIHIGPKPDKASTMVVLGFENATGADIAYGEILLNGHKCAFLGDITLSRPKPESHTYGFKAPEAAVHRGYNLIEVLFEKKVKIIWAELSISP